LDRPWPWLRCGKDDWEKVKAAVRGVMDSTSMAPWFDGSGKVFAERDLVGPDGKMLRPDRVVDFGDRVDVVDFKTGEYTEDGQRDAHLKQVRGYMQALRHAEGPLVRGFLYYVKEDDLVEVVPV